MSDEENVESQVNGTEGKPSCQEGVNPSVETGGAQNECESGLSGECGELLKKFRERYDGGDDIDEIALDLAKSAVELSRKSAAKEAESKIAALEKERDEFKDKWMRSVADFQNLRKRSIQEKQEAFDYGNANLLKDLLDSLDNFDRTVEAAASATDAKSIADGVTMINKSLVSMLENKYNLVAYGASGDPFDPDIHEAIGKVDEDVAEPVLKAVYLKGYRLKDRVIRHAKVMVSMPLEKKESE